MNGFCAPNIAGPFNDETLRIVEAGQFRSAKLMPYHTQYNIAQLHQVGVTQFISRLPELSIGVPWQTLIGPVLAQIDSLYPACHLFQVGNEPNDVSAWGLSAWEYQFYMRYIMQGIKSHCVEARIAYGEPDGIQMILPPLSYAPALWRSLNVWKLAFTQRPDHEGRIPALCEYMQFAGANSYWQYPRFLRDGSYGMNWADVHNWSGLPVHVLEYGYTAYLLGLPQNTIEKQMILDYPTFVAQSEQRTPPALSAHVFLVGGTPDWAGLSITRNVALALAAGEARAASVKGATS